MTKEIRYRSYREGDEEEIIQLLNIAFKKWPNIDVNCTAKEFWYWKYRDNPLRDSVIAVAEAEGKIVGAAHLHSSNIVIYGNKVKGVLAGDIAVHTDYRGLGIAKQLNDTTKDLRHQKGIYFYYFATRNPHLIQHHKKVDKLLPQPITNLVKIKDINLHLQQMPADNAWFLKTGYKALEIHRNAKKLLKKEAENGHSYRIEKIQEFSNEITTFWENKIRELGFTIDRTKDYLNWKYCDPRVSLYKIFGAYSRSGELVAYIITRINKSRKDYPVGYIVDQLTLPNHKEATVQLIEEALKTFEEEKINIVLAATSTKAEIKKQLLKQGFNDSRIYLNIFYNYDDPMKTTNIFSATQSSQIHFMYGDLDALPNQMSHFE